MLDEKDFGYAVQLAAAFVANGDVRLPDGSIHPDKLYRVVDLIDSCYKLVRQARQETPKDDRP